MAKSELIKAAIADAKSLQDLALQNAKNALEEAFTPQLKSMLSTKLQQEMEGDDEDADDVLDGEAEDGLESEFDEEENLDSEMGEEESLDDLDSEMGEDELDMGDEAEADLDMDLDSEEDEMEEGMEDNNFDGEDDEEEAEATMEGEEDLNLDDDDEMGEDDDLELESILKELEEMSSTEGDDLSEGDEFDDEMGEDDLEEVVELKAENVRLTTELDEATKVISIQKNAMNETKLLNAKLLFTNKLFKEISMTEGQKLKVIEGFDKAETIKEAKLVFEATQNALATVKSPKRRVSESSRTIPGKTGARKKLNVNESSAIKFKHRMQVLANLRKENILKNN